MRIRVEQITPCKDNDTIEVLFSAKYGCFEALWIGEKPTLYGLYDVELDLDDNFVWGENIFTTLEEKPSMAITKRALNLVGTVISLEEDGCLSIALGDSIILIEVRNAPENISGLVKCQAARAKAFPIDL